MTFIVLGSSTLRGVPVDADEDSQLGSRQLHAQGRTYIEIGLELGFGRDTVKKHLATAQG